MQWVKLLLAVLAPFILLFVLFSVVILTVQDSNYGLFSPVALWKVCCFLCFLLHPFPGVHGFSPLLLVHSHWTSRRRKKKKTAVYCLNSSWWPVSTLCFPSSGRGSLMYSGILWFLLIVFRFSDCLWKNTCLTARPIISGLREFQSRRFPKQVKII